MSKTADGDICSGCEAITLLQRCENLLEKIVSGPAGYELLNDIRTFLANNEHDSCECLRIIDGKRR